MNHLITIFKRELGGYFNTPVAYVFLVIFLALSGAFSFYIGNLFERGQADLVPFFNYHPWLYLVLIPAIAMRLWAEERKSGTIELIMTLPVPQWAWVIGKFGAAWIFSGIALVMTFPIWATVAYLGTPDHGVILASYLGSWLMAGGFLAIGSCMSAMTKNQVVAFILTVVICFLFVFASFNMVQAAVQDWAPQWLIDTVAEMSVLTHFDSVKRGVISVRDFFYFISLIVVWLFATLMVLELKKAD